MSEEPIRLQKILARAGIASRRVCEEYIEEGRVKVNGAVAVLGNRALETDEISVDDVVLSMKPDAVTYLLNKPTGVVSSASDTHGRQVVTELVPDEPRVFPVGRLDMDTEGLILLTNDGDLAHRLTHPSFGVEKQYLAHVEGEASPNSIRKLRKGVELEDGITSPAKVSTQPGGIISLTIHEGKNRQVRRMCDAVGHPVQRLVRVRIGPIRDPKLKPGEHRKLEQSEILALQKAIIDVVDEQEDLEKLS